MLGKSGLRAACVITRLNKNIIPWKKIAQDVFTEPLYESKEMI